MKLNYQIRRNLLFEWISSLELDLRAFLSLHLLDVSPMQDQIQERIKKHYGDCNPEVFDTHKYEFLDFGDYFQLLSKWFKANGFTESVHKEFLSGIEGIIPIRNRVMHSRPLLHEDDEIVEAFVDKVSKYHPFFAFDNLKKSLELIGENPQIFYENAPDFTKVFIRDSIENNLPIVDYDDTGFVGREEKKDELRKKIRGAHPIISVIGSGGVGKTSLVLSCIYDMIDKADFLFEKVLWTTLKTKSLQDGEFKDLKGAVRSFSDCVEKNKVLNNDGVKSIDDLLFYMQCYRTLLILDNLETINSSEVKKLFDDIPMGSKVIITSRIGVGEYESRLNLKEFTENEACSYFRRLTKAYSAKSLSALPQDEVKDFCKKLFFFPLCIKWFVINVAKGHSPVVLTHTKEELIEFCLSNVFDKLGDDAKHVLTIVMLRQRKCPLAEIVYVNGQDYIKTVSAINELCACSFLEQNEYGVYTIPEFAGQYLANKIDRHSVEYNEVNNRINKMLSTIRNLEMKNDPHRATCFRPNGNSERIAMIYALKLIEASRRSDEKEMDLWMDLAMKAAPKYADIYRVAGVFYSVIRLTEKADEYYRLALDYADATMLPFVQSSYALFLAHDLQDCEGANRFIDEALSVFPEDPYFLFNQAKIQRAMGQADKAITLLEGLLETKESFDLSFAKSVYVEYSETLIKKLANSSRLTVSSVNRIVRHFEQVGQEFYSFPLYLSMLKFARAMEMEIRRIPIGQLFEKFVHKYFPFLLFAAGGKTDELFSMVNLHSNKKIVAETYSVTFPVQETGRIINAHPLEGYGFIFLRPRAQHVFFHLRDTYFGREYIVDGTQVVFTPRYEKQKWRAVSVELAPEEAE